MFELSSYGFQTKRKSDLERCTRPGQGRHMQSGIGYVRRAISHFLVIIKEPYLHRDPSGRPRHLSSFSRVSESCESLTSGTPDKLCTEGGASPGLWPRPVTSASPSGLSLCDSSSATSSNHSLQCQATLALESLWTHRWSCLQLLQRCCQSQ